MTKTTRELLAIGKLAKAFGVRGELIVLPMTDAPQRFRRLKQLLVGTDEETTAEMAVAGVRIEPRGIRLKLEGIDDRDAAERLVGSLLFVDADHRIRLPKGRYFIHDIVGLTVVDETRGVVGTVHDVLKYPAHDVYVVAFHDREYMIPAVKEFIRDIDLPSGRLTVRLIEGMTDENETA
ncbi:MAG TPA: ribosome maturation factor RimM [Bacteroidota bacterium]